MLNKNLIEEILGIALGHKGEFSEVFLENSHSFYFYWDDKKVEEVTYGEDIGAGIRVIQGDKIYYGYTTDISEFGLKKLAHELSEVVLSGENNKKIILENKKEFITKTLKDYKLIEVREGIDLLKIMDETSRNYSPRIVQFTSVIRNHTQEILIANSDGDFVEEKRIRSVVYGFAVGEKDGLIQTGYEAVGATLGWELFTEDLVKNVALEASRRAVLMLEAVEAPAGIMPVIISSQAGGVIIHEAVGHGLEADLVEKGVSVYKDKIGEKVASDSVTLVDAGVLEEKYGSSYVDDEGVKTNYNVLIDRGILKGYMHSRITAKKFGVSPTGNGRRQSFRYPPIPRMTNTFILSGNSKLEDMLNRVEKGLYVVKMGGGQVDTISGDFVFGVEEGYLIESGKIKNPVRGATLIGNGPKILEKIELIGDDIGFTPGTCGKDGQGVPVTDGMPTILISEITIGGTKKRED